MRNLKNLTVVSWRFQLLFVTLRAEMCQMRQFDFINLYRQAVIAKEQGDMARSVTRIAVLLFIPLLLLTAGCQENVGQRKGVDGASRLRYALSLAHILLAPRRQQ